MCAVRVARFNTNKKLVVTFGGAYHGWWDGMQPVAGNERVPFDVLCLKDMSALALTTIKLRGSEIAAVLVNPLQCFHLNQSPPSDPVLSTNNRKVRPASSVCHASRTILSEQHGPVRTPGSTKWHMGRCPPPGPPRVQTKVTLTPRGYTKGTCQSPPPPRVGMRHFWVPGFSKRKFRDSPQFPQFSRNCFLLVHLACVLVPCVSPRGLGRFGYGTAIFPQFSGNWI